MLCFFTFFASTTLTEPWEQKLSKALIEKARLEPVTFIIQLKSQADLSKSKLLKTKKARANFAFKQLKTTATKSQTNLIQLLKNANAPIQSFYVVNAIASKGDIELIQLLAEQPEVEKIIENSPFKIDEPIIENVATQRDIMWGILMINADEVWDMGYRGQGVVVGGQDTGYDWTHPALQSKYRGWDETNMTANHNYNWHDAIHEINLLHGDSIIEPTNNPCGLNSMVPCDDNNHGTHTMGTMVGSDGNDQIGVAPDAKWISCRNMERGYGSPISYIECFEWLMAPTDLNNENPDPSKAPHVFANSWSCPETEGCDSTNWGIMEMVVNNVKNSGIVVVVSAGNSGSDGCGSISTPASIFENSFTVGATRQNDTITSFSSRGPVMVDNSMRMKPNIVAPGRQVRSSIRDSSYAFFSGTSMSGPHVAGLVALIISANPDLAGQVEVIEDIIEQTAVQKQTDETCGDTPGTDVPNNTYGHGRVDALAAVEMALSMTTPTENLISNANLRVFPNPFQNNLHFEIKDLSGPTQLKVFSATGQLTGTWEWNLELNDTRQISLDQLPGGVYFYQIDHEQGRLEGKVVKY